MFFPQKGKPDNESLKQVIAFTNKSVFCQKRFSYYLWNFLQSGLGTKSESSDFCVCMSDNICSTVWEQTYQFSCKYIELAMPSVWQHAGEQESSLL